MGLLRVVSIRCLLWLQVCSPLRQWLHIIEFEASCPVDIRPIDTGCVVGGTATCSHSGLASVLGVVMVVPGVATPTLLLLILGGLPCSTVNECMLLLSLID